MENSNVTTDHWPANVHLFGIECFNTASSVLKTITLSACDYLEIVILQPSEIQGVPKNIARGTTDPGYRVYNLSYISS